LFREIALFIPETKAIRGFGKYASLNERNNFTKLSTTFEGCQFYDKRRT